MKPYNWRFYACIVCALAAIRPGLAQPNVVPEYRGEIQKQSASFFHGFVVQLDSLASSGALKAVVTAQKLSESGEYEKAARKLEEALRISPDYADAWTNLTVQHVRLRRFDEAIVDANRAIQFAGPNSVDLCNLALAQWAVHRFPEALESALRGAELDPSSAKAQYLAGALLAGARRWNEALPHLQYAARSLPAARLVLDHAPSSVRQSFRP